MRLPAVLALAATLLASAFPAQAVTVRGLYEASIPVRSQHPDLREAALRAALEMVLVRVVGTRALPQPALDLLGRAGTFVQGYGYESAAGGGRDLRLRATFDARAIETALREQGLSVWGANRPAHIAWIALRDDGQPRGILDASAAETRAPVVAATAEARGLPLTFPQLDATDRQMVTFNELWSGSFTGAEGASARYNARMVLVGRVGREGGQWLARWTLLGADVGDDWVSSGPTLEHVLAAGIHDLADRQAQRFAVQTGNTRDLQLRVHGVESLNDYGRALGYVRGLGPVRSAQVTAVEPGALSFNVRVEGNPDTLARVIAAGRVLRARDNGRFATSLDYDLVAQ